MTKRILTDKFIQALKPAPASQRYIEHDALVPGLGVRVTDSGHKTFGHLEKFLSPSRHESDSVIVRGHGRMERAGHGADGLFRC